MNDTHIQPATFNYQDYPPMTIHIVLTPSQKSSYSAFTTKRYAVSAPVRLAVFLCLKHRHAHNFKVMARLRGGNRACLNTTRRRIAVVEAAPPLLGAAQTLTKRYGVSKMTNQATQGKPAQNPQNQDEAVNGFLQQIRVFEIERKAVIDAGLPALQRLATTANNDTGQAGTVRRFLLGLYNGHRWPFDLTTLRGLDKDLFDDCIDVLKLDARATVKEVHQYFKNGGELFKRFAKMEGKQ